MKVWLEDYAKQVEYLRIHPKGVVNVTDIVGMVNIIMKGGTQNVREAMSVLRRSGFIF